MRSRLCAISCSLFLLLCTLVAYPTAEIGMNDDFSYIKSAQILASTGHVAYNGWAAAILGWQLYLGALFIKIFGFSFTAVRSSTTLVAALTVFLVHRCLVRSGINTWNAMLGTLTLIACPVFLPLSTSFMSDIDGLFCIVLCFYACLRALRAQSNRATLAWLVFAGLTNALGGTVRQPAWLGVLVLFPCAAWLLRRRPHVLIVAAIVYLVSLLVIYATHRWFLQQPYSIPDTFSLHNFTRQSFKLSLINWFAAFLSSALFLLPVLAAFVPFIRFSDRHTRNSLIAGVIALGVFGFGMAAFHLGHHLLAPFSVNYFTPRGAVDSCFILGNRPVILGLSARLLLSSATFASILAFVVFLLQDHPSSSAGEHSSPITWCALSVLVCPMALAYLGLHVPRSLVSWIFDRYLLPVLFFSVIVCLRLFQENARPKVPVSSFLVAMLFIAYSTAATHDVFAMYRARLQAVREIEAAQIPATAIDGSFDFNGTTQIEISGHLNDPRVQVPRGGYQPMFLAPPAPCQSMFLDLTPSVRPLYTLSYDPNLCDGPSQFAPVSYHNWMGPRTVTIYIVKPGNLVATPINQQDAH